MKPDGGEKCSPESVAVSHYETLRAAGLGEALPPEARGGLMLFLRRGMWGWARTIDSASASRPPIRSPSPSSAAPTAIHESRAVIHIFAAMAIDAARTDNQGAAA